VTKLVNVRLIDRSNILSNDAVLSVVDDIPFDVKRIFYIHSASTHQDRGDHAHRCCHQIYVCIRGSIFVECTDGKETVGYTLTENSDCLHIPPMVWSTEKGFDKNTIFLVLCSEIYDEYDYIRSFDIFLEENYEKEKESMG